MRVTTALLLLLLLLLMVVLLAGCNTSSGRADTRYIVSATPLHFLKPVHPGFCVAVDPTETKGVWWWEPGRSGCATRSTGPQVFPANGAKVAKTSGAIEVRFDVQLTTGSPLEVHLTVHDDSMRLDSSGERVAIERRRDLDVPELCCPPTAQSR
jgi:hypothetical protein